MAQRTTVKLIDDIDGGEADETITFGFRGQSYEIDLAAVHIAEMAEFLGPFMQAARQISAPTIRGRATRSIAHAADRRRSLNYGDVRAWAGENGFEVAPRGRIPQRVIDAYNAR